MVKHLADIVMSGGYVVGGLVAVAALVIGAAWGITQKALGDMMSTEVENRLADLPALILSVTTLITTSREDRKDLFEEYYGELAACVEDGDRYPVTRLVRGIGFALGVARAELTHFVLVRFCRPVARLIGRAFGNAPGETTIESSEMLNDVLDELNPAADRERNQLIEAVARELRILVNALGTSLNALSVEQPNTLPWIVHAETLMVRSAQIEGIVSDLLLLLRIRDPANAPGETTIEISEMLNDVLDELNPDAAHKDIECVLTTPTGPAYVVGDPRELRAAFLHLVKNALTYSYRGSRVQVMLYTAGSEVTIVVADAGVGIAEDELSEVCQPFFRGTNAALGGSRGAGLGLTLIDRITQRHYGLLELASRPSEGTQVALTLPGV